MSTKPWHLCIHAGLRAHTNQLLHRPLASMPQLAKMRCTLLCCDALRCCCSCCWSMHSCTGGYSSNADLLDALLTGAHIPRTSSGSLLIHYRGHLYMDSGRHTSMRMGEGRYPYQALFSLMHDAGAAPRGAPPMSWDKCVTRDLQAFG